MNAEATKEHAWLSKLVGEWVGEVEGSDDPSVPAHPAWTETVRTLGDYWVIAEGASTMPDGTPAHSIMSLGFDPAKGRFVGTWLGSMMPNLWVYDGALNDAGDVLALESEGPSFDVEGEMRRYRDSIELVSHDHRRLISEVLRPDGTWEEFMRLSYRRR
ncbi:DUF1579 domain-containing protein [Phenylobacterium deserti]|uniref:DUF1579 domain-containing protein n=1 Tax=Phenylobacterium deserti TaxID=1914756 RepID=A0A328ANN7_9CAUL|nr:DUF1579 domain-containing protein [Phenylobacterium deserti]RAK56623.1 hypothetical protein DJ018_01185 [Phenylobacterium deserti]